MIEPRRFRLVAGLQPVREAIRIHKDLLGALIIESRESQKLLAVERFARDQGVREISRLARRELDKMAGDTEHQGLICWAPALRLLAIEELLKEPNLVAIALDEIQDPQNFGAVVRCAVAVSDAAVIWGEHSSAPLTPATFRASAGAVEQARLCRVPSLRDALQRFVAVGASVIGLEPRAAKALHELAFPARTVLVIGSENKGICRGVRTTCTEYARLSSSGKLDSLNASVAAGIALYAIQMSRLRSDG